MAVTVSQYNTTKDDLVKRLEIEIAGLEKDIDAALVQAASDNIIPNAKNAKFVLRFGFKTRISKDAKQYLKVKYGNAGWHIVENVSFQDTQNLGYFDFYREKPK